MVFVDDAADDSSSPYGCVDRDDDVGVEVGWMLIEALVWTVQVEVVLVVTQHGSSVLVV
jgi:hypothetical protein